MPDIGPLRSINWARAYLGSLKGVKRISYTAIVRLVQQEGLPTTPNPFNPGAWAFQQSEIDTWFRRYTELGQRAVACAGRPKRVLSIAKAKVG